MASADLWDAPDIVPALTYADVPRAVEWLVRVFGFREREEARLSWPGGGIAWIETGNGLFSVATPDETWGESAGSGAARVVMKVYVSDVDEHFARAKREGASVVSEPQDGFWGGRIYRALDPEGHRWEISQRGRDLTAGRWQLPSGVTRGVSK
jgi:uncharacterized glyoxalase superfamily protein PhnB